MAEDNKGIIVGKVTSVGATQRTDAGMDPAQPDFRSDFHTDQMPRWMMVDALWGGTETMRIAGEAYLPKYQNEPEKNWQVRLSRAVLLNYFRKTVVGYVGKPLGKPLVIPEELPDEIKSLLEDVDDAGTNIDMFAREALTKGISKGMVHAYVDFPPAPEEGQSAADEASKQPYVVLINPEMVLGARCEKDEDSGQEELTQVRILECTTEPNGEFGEQTVERIRVLEKTQWRLYRRTEQAKKVTWVLESQGVNSLGEIPFVTFYADKEGFMRSRPPLLDLAYVNVEHWQSNSDQINVLTVTRFPILYGSGINPEDPLEIGPNSYFALRDPQAKLAYAEHSGAAITAGRTNLEDLKAEMATLGLSLLMPSNSGAPTATAKALDGAEAITELQAMVGNFENFINEIVYYMARWKGLPEDQAYDLAKVLVNSSYVDALGLADNVQALLTTRAGRDISRSALLAALKRRNLLPADFDEEEDAEKLKEEAAASGNGMPPKAGEDRPLVKKDETDNQPGAKPAPPQEK